MALSSEEVEQPCRELSLPDAARTDDRFDDKRLVARLERFNHLAELVLPPDKVANDVRLDQTMVPPPPKPGGSPVSERISAVRRVSVSAASETKIAHEDESLRAASRIVQNVNAMTCGARRQAGQVSRRFSRIAEALAVERDRQVSGERSRSLQNPRCELLSRPKDLHEAMRLDLHLADFLGDSLSRGLKAVAGRRREHLCAVASESLGARPFCLTERGSTRVERRMVPACHAPLHMRSDSGSPLTAVSSEEDA